MSFFCLSHDLVYLLYFCPSLDKINKQGCCLARKGHGNTVIVCDRSLIFNICNLQNFDIIRHHIVKYCNHISFAFVMMILKEQSCEFTILFCFRLVYARYIERYEDIDEIYPLLLFKK